MLRNSLIRRPINPLVTTDPLEAISRFRWPSGTENLPWRFMDWNAPSATPWPQADLSEQADGWSIQIDLPGLNKKSVDINLERNVLTVTGERQKPETEGVRTERWYGSFRRTFLLPRAADADQIVAKFKDGVLTIDVPKSAEAKPRQIAVN